MSNYQKVAITVPTLNEEHYVAALLDSIQSQTRLPDELVAIDRSHDSTPLQLEQAGFRVIPQKRGNISRARQEVFQATTSELIVSTDADSMLASNYVERVQEIFEDPTVVAAYGPVYLYDGIKLWNILGQALFVPFLRISQLLGKPNCTGMNFVCRATAFNQVGGFSPELTTAEDVDLGLRLKKVGRVIYDKDLVVYTSSRRIAGMGLTRFVAHHVVNYTRVLAGKTVSEDFVPYR